MPARHPLFAGILWCLFKGDAAIALPAAVFFELIWLDLIYVGTYVPPNAMLAYLVFLATALVFGFTVPQQMVLLLVVCLPLASLGGKAEGRLRLRQGKAYHHLIGVIDKRAAEIPAELARLVRASLAVQAGYYASLCLLSSGAVFVFAWLLGVRLGWWPVSQALLPELPGVGAGLSDWGLLWAFAAVGGLLSLRIRWALASFVCASIAVAVFLVF